MRDRERKEKGQGDHNWVDLPSPDEIKEQDRLRSEAIKALEFSKMEVECVKCQRCGEPKIIYEPAQISTNKTRHISVLERKIKWMEGRGVDAQACLKDKKELAALLQEEAQQDLLRRLPLYSSAATGYRWFCSGCYDNAYLDSRSSIKTR